MGVGKGHGRGAGLEDFLAPKRSLWTRFRFLVFLLEHIAAYRRKSAGGRKGLNFMGRVSLAFGEVEPAQSGGSQENDPPNPIGIIACVFHGFRFLRGVRGNQFRHVAGNDG